MGDGLSAESLRLVADAERDQNWKRWGPYLAERQWATVREDYSPDGNCWEYFPHDHARSRAYRWGEDGLLGICDRQCRLCFGLALWNGRDPILKERLFGLTGPQGNHGEDVKECYFYIDSTPTHSYMRALYKYPQSEFPYRRLIEENAGRGRDKPEFELSDTGVFDEERYFDVLAEYAKASPQDILIRISVCNRGPDVASVDVLPTVWFRNTWSWGCQHEGCELKSRLEKSGEHGVLCDHPSLGRFRFEADPAVPVESAAEWLFTENETNSERVFGGANARPFVKDAFHRYVIHGERGAVNPAMVGTKAAVRLRLLVPAGGSVELRFRLSAESEISAGAFGPEFEAVFKNRITEADEFYDEKLGKLLPVEERRVARQAAAGLLWGKQFYHYVVQDWLDGDPNQPPPPGERRQGRNSDWRHVFCRDVISMPDKWEYPWFAAWDTAFHMVAMARIDPGFAKEQLILFLREWYMHPSGAIPAYEFAFGDVNPPVHAWACWKVYVSAPRGHRDRLFLGRCFQKLLINFTWWVNRKDPSGRHLFSGGFLGLDNIGIFDRSRPLPTGGVLEQADGTAWMAFYCGTMLAMALELAREDPEYEDVASKFFEHFVAITDAMNTLGGTGLWNEETGFYFDHLMVEGKPLPLKVRSMVGLIPLFAVGCLHAERIDKLPGFCKRLKWFLENRADLARNISYFDAGKGEQGSLRLLAIPSMERLTRTLKYVLDEAEFLSPHGVRSLSRFHLKQPFELTEGDQVYSVSYVPGEADTAIFGGNSNWRGPVWFPLNYLLIDALERYHEFYGDMLRVECPVGSGRQMNLLEVAEEIRRRLVSTFLPNGRGERPCHGGEARFAADPHWRDLLLFHEYFHGETGKGLGASHQTGWTALVIPLLCERARRLIS